jgi:hypothetical protein
MRIVTRNENKTPTTALATPLQLEIDGAHGEFLATSAVIDTIGRQFENDDIRVFVDRQEVAKLAAAVHYTRRTMEGGSRSGGHRRRCGSKPRRSPTASTSSIFELT